MGFAGTECRIASASVRAPGGRREEPRADLPDDRGPGGRRVGRLGRACQLVRAAGVRRPLPLGPLPERRWPRRAGVARCVGHRLRAGRDHDDAAARHPRLAGHLPPPERVGQGGRHGRPHLERAGGARNWDGVAGGGARGLRLPVPADGRADETARRAAGSHHARVERWTAELQRGLLRDNQPRRAPEAGADAAPAAHRRRGGRAAVGGAAGGAAGPRSAALAARYADEYNTVYVSPEVAKERRETLDRACEAQNRDPRSLRFSMMNGFVIGSDPRELDQRRAELTDWGAEPGEPWIVGTPDEVVARLKEYEAAGVEGVMLQHHLFHDEEALELIGGDVIPAPAT